MDRAQKAQAVEELDQVFQDAESVIVCHYKGMTVSEMADFRAKVREVGGKVRVAKNRLAKIALKDKACEGLSIYLNGQTVLIYGDDPVAPAKAVESYAKANPKLEIVGGALGSEVMDPAGVVALSKMPSREETLAQIVGALMGPGASLAAAITAPGANIAGVLKTIEEREDAS